MKHILLYVQKKHVRACPWKTIQLIRPQDFIQKRSGRPSRRRRRRFVFCTNVFFLYVQKNTPRLPITFNSIKSVPRIPFKIAFGMQFVCNLHANCIAGGAAATASAAVPGPTAFCLFCTNVFLCTYKRNVPADIIQFNSFNSGPRFQWKKGPRRPAGWP